jgi:hypothetical protein
MKKLYFCFLLFVLMNINSCEQGAFRPATVDLLQYQEDKQLHSLSSVCMWGWSRNGKVAYTVEKEQDGRDGYITAAIIFDFVDNVVLWEQEIDSIDITGNKETEAVDYDRFYENFKKICLENGIEFVQVEFKKLPIRHNNRTFNVAIEIIEEEENELRLLDRIDSYIVSVETQGKKKTVKEKNDVWAFHVLLCGYFISPYEDRVLIVTGERVLAFEDVDIDFYFIGCDLSYGFN